MTTEFTTLVEDLSGFRSRVCGAMGSDWSALEEVLKKQRQAVASFRARRLLPSSGWRSPLGIQLEVTYRCNLRCIHCYNMSGPKREDELTSQEWFRIAHEFGEAGVREAVISGGEPFIRKLDTLRIMEILDSYGVYFVLITNGWFVDEELVNQLSTFRFRWIQVSIDGARPEIHDQIRGVKNSWLRAVRAARLFVEAELPTVIAHVVMPDNLSTLEEMIDLAHVLGVRQILCDSAIYVGRAAAIHDQLSIDRDDQRQRYQGIMDRKAHEYRTSMVIRSAMEPALGLRVYAGEPNRIMLVRPNGDAKMDCIAPFVFGNLRDESVLEVWQRMKLGWQHPVVRDFVESIHSNEGLYQLPGYPIPHLERDRYLYALAATIETGVEG